MFKFAHPEILYVLILIPVFVVIYFIAIRQRKRALKDFGDQSGIQEVMRLM